MANSDRIFDVYRGEAGSPEFQARARDRIHWLVAQAGGRVLDVGCSQGITSLLCARAGLEVLGIDNEEDRIEFALAERAQRPAEVQERLEFRVADATALDLPDSSFDTVIVGEVLEHLADPSTVLAEVERVAAPDASVVLTTPFGYHPHRDHRQTFYLASLVETIAPHLTISSLEIVTDYFRITTRPGPMPSAEADALILAAQPQAEAALFVHQRNAHRLERKRFRYAKFLQERLRPLRRKQRRLERRLLAAKRSRWSRLGDALAGARTPGGLLRLPREALRATRNLSPPEREPSNPDEDREPVKQRSLIKTAEASAETGELRVEVPKARPFPDGPVARPGLRVATILDRFSAAAFRYEWDQVEVGPGDWRERLEGEPPDLLFVESAWKGNEDRWAQAIAGKGPVAAEFAELVAWCRAAGVPTVFWNKEDPPHFSSFVATAALFDHVFTTDSDCIGPYKEVLGREDISILSFAAQPRIHNPISVPAGRMHDVAFAGTYLQNKHPARRAQMEAILAPAREFGLHIFSRVAPGEWHAFEWPEEYIPHVVGSLPYERMITAYKAYRLFLNVNTVTASPSMCARRVFELSATATPVLSGYSRALEEMFGGEISIAATAGEAREQLEALLGDPEVAERRAHEAMRHVFREHTYGHRVDEILGVAGIGGRMRSEPPLISAVVAAPGDPPTALLEQLNEQSRPPHEIIPFPSEGLEAAADRATGELVAVVDPDCEYGPHFLEDLVAAFAYTDAAVIGKAADGAAAHSFTLELHAGTLLTTTALARELRFGATPGDTREFLAACRRRNVRGYAADRYSFRARAVAAGARAADTAS